MSIGLGFLGGVLSGMSKSAERRKERKYAEERAIRQSTSEALLGLMTNADVTPKARQSARTAWLALSKKTLSPPMHKALSQLGEPGELSSTLQDEIPAQPGFMSPPPIIDQEQIDLAKERKRKAIERGDFEDIPLIPDNLDANQQPLLAANTPIPVPATSAIPLRTRTLTVQSPFDEDRRLLKTREELLQEAIDERKAQEESAERMGVLAEKRKYRWDAHQREHKLVPMRSRGQDGKEYIQFVNPGAKGPDGKPKVYEQIRNNKTTYIQHPTKDMVDIVTIDDLGNMVNRITIRGRITPRGGRRTQGPTLGQANNLTRLINTRVKDIQANMKHFEWKDDPNLKKFQDEEGHSLPIETIRDIVAWEEFKVDPDRLTQVMNGRLPPDTHLFAGSDQLGQYSRSTPQGFDNGQSVGGRWINPPPESASRVNERPVTDQVPTQESTQRDTAEVRPYEKREQFIPEYMAKDLKPQSQWPGEFEDDEGYKIKMHEGGIFNYRGRQVEVLKMFPDGSLAVRDVESTATTDKTKNISRVASELVNAYAAIRKGESLTPDQLAVYKAAHPKSTLNQRTPMSSTLTEEEKKHLPIQTVVGGVRRGESQMGGGERFPDVMRIMPVPEKYLPPKQFKTRQAQPRQPGRSLTRLLKRLSIKDLAAIRYLAKVIQGSVGKRVEQQVDAEWGRILDVLPSGQPSRRDPVPPMITDQ